MRSALLFYATGKKGTRSSCWTAAKCEVRLATALVKRVACCAVIVHIQRGPDACFYLLRMLWTAVGDGRGWSKRQIRRSAAVIALVVAAAVAAAVVAAVVAAVAES